METEELAELEGLRGGFLSSTSMSTKTAFNVEGSSLVKVPCLTNLEPVEPELEVEMVLGAGLASGARILDLGVCLGLGGDFCLSCLSWVDRVPLGDPGMAFLVWFILGLGAMTGFGGT